MESNERDFEQDLISQYQYWAVYLHENQSYLGRTYIALLRGSDNEEIDPFIDTNIEEREELTSIFNGLKTALDVLYQPTRLNYSNLRNQWHHCHWHVVPRYEGEENGRRTIDGFNFYDMNKGKNYAPAPKLELPENIFQKIKVDLFEALNTTQ